MADLLAIGYQVRVCILTTSDYSVPQARHRLLLFAARPGYRLPAPRPHTAFVSVEDALRDFEDVPPAEESGLVRLPSGALVTHHYREGTDDFASAPPDDLVHLSQCCKGAVAAVRRRQRIRHHRLPRFITVRERARLQAFPDDYLFCGSRVDMHDQIENAVPVQLVESIAHALFATHAAAEGMDPPPAHRTSASARVSDRSVSL